MSESVWIERLEKGDPGSRANRRIIAMDHIPSLPRSYKGNTELLIFEDLFSGYVIAKASGSRTAQTILNQRQRATMAYRPQANGSAERMRHYQQAREQVNQRLREAISDRADQHNDIVRPHQVEVGSRMWLYLDRIGEYAVKLEIARSAYHIFPIVYVAKIKPVREFPDRPVVRLVMQYQDRLDFDEALLPGDSWIQDRDPDEYEVEKISDMRTGRKTRYGRILREFLVHWRGYEDPTWIDEADLNCGAILHEFLRDRANQNRFGVMQSHEEA
ncbi:hypothetical protein PHMEG_00024432 [Phytophthora megakarya]|uniref:Chromo domain-containing protein n=1 Tax=Phytophthora megakarya TaxID=4795 RepID=A0A225VFS9_9STRA|nr:hypothetical protein PHMEG_00024432 [Phytophthora megakarya]